MNVTHPWTEAEKQRLITLWNRNMSYLQIASIMRRKRNSIASKCRQLHLRRDGYASRHKVTRKLKVAISKPIEIKVTVDIPVTNNIEEYTEKFCGTGNIFLLDARNDQCRWPLESAKLTEPRCCGDPIVEGTPYCGRHACIAYRNPKGWETTAERFPHAR